MARTTNSLLHQVSGMLGNQIVFKKYYDKTVISVKPDMSKRVLSPKQIEWNERMTMATDYAKFIYTTEEGKLKARLRLKLPAHKSLFHGLVKEHLDKYKHMSLDDMDGMNQSDLG